MTTRKHLVRLDLALVLSAVAFGGGGCATPGALHLYSLPNATATSVADTGAKNVADTPSFIKDGETVIGFAYDPFTDHFFLRLAPGDAIRVVDRPARAIKREFKLAQLGMSGGGDLAIRPRDGHVFAALPGEPTLVEFTRYGDYVGKITLEKIAGGARGVALDAGQNRLLILAGDSPVQVAVHTPDGRQASVFALDRAIAPGCLAFDSEQRELYAPLAGGTALGVFGEDGRFRRELPLRAPFFDVGPRSFLRMF